MIIIERFFMKRGEIENSREEKQGKMPSAFLCFFVVAFFNFVFI